MLVILIVLLCSEPSYQISEKNCLRSNPGVLDAEFLFFNRHSIYLSGTVEDVRKHVALFSLRFNNAHETEPLDIDWIQEITEGVSSFTNSSKKVVNLFLTLKNPELGNKSTTRKKSLKRVTTQYRKYSKAITEINVNNGGVIRGIYLTRQLKTYHDHLKAVKSGFRSKVNSTVNTLLLGHRPKNCSYVFNYTYATAYLRILNFVTCEVHPSNKSSPEESAVDVIEKCNKLNDIALSVNITASIMCLVGYPSFGTNTEGVTGSVSNFQRFWCKIVDEVKRNNSQTQIIMRSAFDYPFGEYIENKTNLYNGRYYEGWWRRREANSYEKSAFVEKVDELEEGILHENCAPECEICSLPEECCTGQFCTSDTSFQPFEKVKRVLVCQSKETRCTPRLPTQSRTPRFAVPDPVTNASRDSDSSIIILFLIAISIASIILISGTIVAFRTYRARKAKATQSLTQQELRDFLDGYPSSSRNPLHDEQESNLVKDLPYDKRLEVARTSFKIYEGDCLGSGAFGVVFKGRIENDDVAVKTLRLGVDKIHLKALTQELKVLSYLGQNENIVNLRGAHTAQLPSGKLYLFLELCPLGNLLDYLRIHPAEFSNTNTRKGLMEEVNEGHLTEKMLLKWTLQIASAMGHLATMKVIHGDIAARNILVFSKENVKLTDFGLSRRVFEYSKYVKNKEEPLPWRHMSIEALKWNVFSVQSDIWSFGVTMWEMFSLGQVPYPGLNWSADFLQHLMDGLRPSRPPHAHPFVYEIMTLCWIKEAQRRPSISLIYSKLSSVLDELHTQQLYCQPSLKN